MSVESTIFATTAQPLPFYVGWWSNDLYLTSSIQIVRQVLKAGSQLGNNGDMLTHFISDGIMNASPEIILQFMSFNFSVKSSSQC